MFIRIYNPDGSESDACGNATRCVAWLMMEETGKKEVRITTNAGALICSKAGKEFVKVNMGKTKTGWKDIPLAKSANTQAPVPVRRAEPNRASQSSASATSGKRDLTTLSQSLRPPV